SHKALAGVETTVQEAAAQRRLTQSRAGSIAFFLGLVTVGGELASRLRRAAGSSYVCALAAFLAIGLPTPAHSQQSSPNGWPAISPEELAMKDDPTNPGASAILLYREQSTDDVKQFATTYFRIKLLTDEGKKYADVEIPYLETATRAAEIKVCT